MSGRASGTSDSTAAPVTLITGGSRGIGEGCARVFVARGAHVVICARGQEAGQALADELTALGPGTCHFEPCDVTRPADLQRVIAATVTLHGQLDCLINNAGWHPDHRPIDGFSIEDLQDLLQLNVVSYFAGCKYALPHLRASRGSIINISSLVGEIGQEWAVTYVTTKGAITAMTKALAVDEARHGVRVNAVLPGVISTPLHQSFVASSADPQATGDLVDSWQWLHRVGTIAEVGQACWFLASDAARFVTGIALPVSGGAELAYGPKLPSSGSAPQ
jgi:NAD(P)-dependent dehydrogenase (short-subunit alcohol dehydrogenase family)